MTVAYETDERSFILDGERSRYKMQVCEGGEFTDEDYPFMVWQIDLDNDGKPWNATPVIGFATLEKAKEYLAGHPESGGRDGLIERIVKHESRLRIAELQDMDIDELEQMLYQLEN